MQNQNIIQLIIERISKYPIIRYQKNNEQELIVFTDTPKGFDIIVSSDKQENTLYLDGFHTHFGKTKDQIESLLLLFFYALSGDIRIKKLSKEGMPHAYKYILQFQEKSGQWVNTEVVGLLFFKFWRKTTTQYLQNHLPIKDADKTEQLTLESK